MPHKIVIGYDGTKSSRKALQAALDLASEHGAQLFVISVALALDLPYDAETRAIVGLSLDRRSKLLLESERLAAERGIKAHFEVLQGHPAEQIVDYAERQDADLIVVGHRDHSKWVRLFFPSVSEKVTKNTKRPVLVVR